MTRWARTVVYRKWWVLSLAILIVLISGVWGLGVFGKLSQGGFIDPGSDSAKVADIIEENLGPQTPDIIAIYTPTDGRSLDAIGPAVTAAVDEFKTEVSTASVKSYWTADAATRPNLLSHDGAMGAVAITLAPDSGITSATFTDLLPTLEVEGAQTQFAGNTVVGVAFNNTLAKDLVVAEAIAIPITLVLLVFIFGGIVAAAVPIFVGVLSVMSALAVLRILTYFTDVSSFSINVASLLGLGLAIDYGLFIVGRFREELESGSEPGAAATRTVLTAGRTVMFSGLLLICAFSGMLVFPQSVIRSLGFGAIAAVLSAAVLSLTAVPALLAILGHRINSWTWRKGAAQRGEERSRRFWGRVVTWVMKRPVAVSVTIVTILLVLASPLLGARLGELSFTALPSDDPARVATETLVNDFPQTGNGATLILQAQGDTVLTPEEAAIIAEAAGQVEGIGQATVVATTNKLIAVQAFYSEGSTSQSQSSAVTDLRAIPAPDGTELLVGGGQAMVDDGNNAVLHWLPVMMLIMVGSTLVLLFLAFGSVVLPIKAVLMAALSLATTFGVLTFVFQDGHGVELLGASQTPLEATFVVLILAVVFGLSTDYEVFLMSRMVEAKNDGATTEEAVKFGTERTGRIVTAAALLLIVVTGAFAMSGLGVMKFLGVGMIVALIVDATIIRMLLVPSLVKLMGDANWWAPAWMKKVHGAVGIGH
ncbi:MMPL family transporter [Rhodococcus sp. IEGM 1379]|uniref:MMPL family transporter n=1 Tax=Rhodococcus sp. IEGM 1379 TaxID=3047086 RepID=UPI0024B8149A|nr:MMPL family transporter [Rhodococcus sp. IEGM 1379]MDI9914716.1 MMPL family transporter [Rhodococcus sp. IEGM 1379]